MEKLVFKNIIFALTIVLIIGLAIGLSACNDKSDNNQGQTSYCKHDDPSQIVLVEAVAPTCQQTGLTEGMKCNHCGTMVVPQTIVSTIDCVESDQIIDRQTTISEEGLWHTICTMCGKMLRQETSQGTLGLKYVDIGGTYEVSCSSLNYEEIEIIIPATYNGIPVTSIGYYAFKGCSSLTSITIPDSVTIIGARAFEGCSSLTNITIPDSVTLIGNSAFSGCSNLTSIIIPESVTYIEDNAFYECFKITICCEMESRPRGWSYDWNILSENILSDTVSITQYHSVIWGCLYSGITEEGLHWADTASGIVVVGYSGTGTDVIIPKEINGINVISIAESAFKDCDKITSITISDSVINIGVTAFQNCSSLESVTIGKNVTSIGSAAFQNCSSLKSVTISDSVTTIGNYAFRDCSNLASITFEGTVEQWKSISFGSYWKDSIPATEVVCSDGVVKLN